MKAYTGPAVSAVVGLVLFVFVTGGVLHQAQLADHTTGTELKSQQVCLKEKVSHPFP